MVIKVCEDKRQIFGGKGKLARLTIVLFLLSSQTLCRSSFAQDINWDKLIPIIAQIESSNNPFAYNSTSHAKGPYQITPICLKEYNARHTASKIASNALYSPIEARKVAEWYLAIRIPQMLKFYGFPCDIEHILWAFNAGIGKVTKGIKPKETRDYLRKFNKLYYK